MRASRQRALVLLCASAVLVFGQLPSYAAKSGGGTGGGATTTKTVTGQGVYGEIKAASSFLVVENDTYAFDEVTAGSYFKLEVTGPVVSCSGKLSDCTNNSPAAPSQPAEDTTRRYDVAVQNMCTFANGGYLSGLTYEKSVSVRGANGRGQYTFTWTYNVSPKVDEAVQPLTAWKLVDSSGPTTATVVVNGWLAAESVMISSQFPAPGKVSFSLDPSRISGLTVTIKDDSTGEVKFTNYPGYKIVQGQDFRFPSSLVTNGTSGLILGESAFNDILKKDGTTSNDTLSNLYFIQLDASIFNLLPGSYSFEFSGSVKDVATTSVAQFSVVKTVHVMTLSCSVPVA